MDRNRLTQVISNLLNNAVKFTTEGTISIGTEKKEVIVSIKDTGSGIDHEILPRLFSKFSAKSFEGYWIRIIYLQKYCKSSWR
jgi:signal transduction histidine kinase